MWLDTTVLDKVLNHENLALLIDTYLLLDKTFVKNLDNTVTGGQLQNTPVENRLQVVNELCFGNIAREYILKMWVFEGMLNLMLAHRNLPLDPYWEDKIKKSALFCKEDNRNKPE